MLSRADAASPTPTNTIRQSRTIGRRVNPNTSRPLSTMISLSGLSEASSKRLSLVGDRKRVVKEQRSVGRNHLAWLQPLENLMVPVVLQPDLHDTLGEAAAVGGDPHHH